MVETITLMWEVFPEFPRFRHIIYSFICELGILTSIYSYWTEIGTLKESFTNLILDIYIRKSWIGPRNACLFSWTVMDRKSEISAVDNYYVDFYGLETLINFIWPRIIEKKHYFLTRFWGICCIPKWQLGIYVNCSFKGIGTLNTHMHQIYFYAIHIL